MKLYTKTGDDGTTGLFGGTRVLKTDARVEAYGTLDETNALLGLARAAGLSPESDALVARVQAELFTLGAELACAPGREAKLGFALVADEEIARLEQAIDHLDAALPALKTFVLPGGSPASATLHVARTTARRAERALLRAHAERAVRAEVLQYLNRLSDLLFVMARAENAHAGVADTPWLPSARARE